MDKDTDLNYVANIYADIYALFVVTKFCLNFMHNCIKINGEADKNNSIYLLEGKKKR